MLMIYVTHDQVEALTFADRVVVMKDGSVLQVGTPLDLFERPEHTFVGYFIGSPGMNLLPATVTGNRAWVGSCEIQLSGTYPSFTDRTAQLGIRPDHAILAAPGQGLPVRVQRVDDLGRVRLARVMLGDHPLVATVPQDMSVPTGEAAVTFEKRRLHVYIDERRVEGVAA